MSLALEERSQDLGEGPKARRPRTGAELRVLIVCEHASARFGGEAALPLHYFRVLRAREVPVWLITHARTRDELSALFPADASIHYVEDTMLNRAMWRLGQLLPDRIGYFTVGFVSRFATQLAQRRLARQLIAREYIDIVHQPMPVSPREPSMMFGLGAPVVIGPMNGAMDYPAAFRQRRRLGEGWMLGLGRASAAWLNRLMPGKRRAALLLVANPRTQAALPAGVCNDVVELVENGVDLSLWRSTGGEEGQVLPFTQFVYMGRLVECKAVDMLVEAFVRAARTCPISLVIMGDGSERAALERLALHAGVHTAGSEAELGRIAFCGWLSQSECAERLHAADCLVMPSLLDCGGAVVLEAMAMAKPVIATAWGGPTDYLDESCGILVPPSDRAALVSGFAGAMTRLACAPSERRRMGDAGRAKVEREYDWDVKAERILKIYESVVLLTDSEFATEHANPNGIAV
jgi:glycosyltransferase involved in cell wall biosynthesis